MKRILIGLGVLGAVVAAWWLFGEDAAIVGLLAWAVGDFVLDGK